MYKVRSNSSLVQIQFGMWVDVDDPYNFRLYVFEVKCQGHGSNVNLVHFLTHEINKSPTIAYQWFYEIVSNLAGG
jgi:hypothetical protein